MASKESACGQPVCLVCLETHDTLKVVPVCKHVVCRGCLLKHLASQGPSTESFPCPTCHVKSTLPGDGVGGFMDYDDVDGEGSSGNERQAAGGMENSVKDKLDECGSCRFTKGSSVPAEALCDECGHVYLCVDCKSTHAKNSVTASHVVSSLKSLQKKKREGVCNIHKQQINSFCCSCSQPCCYLCVLLSHGNHDVKTIADAFRCLVEDLKNATDGQEKRSTNLRKCEGQLKVLNASEVSKEKDILVQEIEDQAERCIEQIIKQKDALKEQVLTKYQAVTEVSEWIDKLPGLQVLDKIVPKAKQILSEVGPHPDDLQQLSVMLKQVTDVRIDDDVAARLDGYWDTYRSLFRSSLSFVPTHTSYNIGDMTVKERTNNVKKAKLVHEKRLEVDNNTKFIPSVAKLGNGLYAVAHPVLRGQPSNGIDVYKFPGELQRTITDNLPPFNDMIATPVGEIAILSDGATAGTCSVLFVCPETGNIRSTIDLAVSGRPLSFDINIYHQCTVLYSSDGVKRLTLFNEDGSVEIAHLIDEASEVKGACRIRWSAKHVIIMGSCVFVVYERRGQDLVKVATSPNHSFAYKDISLNLFDNEMVYQCFLYLSRVWIQSYTLQNNQLDNLMQKCIGQSTGGADDESRLAVGDNFIVVSWGHAVHVYSW